MSQWVGLFCSNRPSRGFTDEQWETVCSLSRGLDQELAAATQTHEGHAEAAGGGGKAQTLAERAKAAQKPRVYVRVRPLSSEEEISGEGYMPGIAQRTRLGTDQAPKVDALDATDARRSPLGGFAGVFGPEATNRDVYESALKSELGVALRGGAVTLFSYGHTSTGKTHTVLGYGAELGLYRLAAMEIFAALETMNGDVHQRGGEEDSKLMLSVRFAELYQGKCFDLNNQRQELTLRDDEEGCLRLRAPTVKEGGTGRVRMQDQATALCTNPDELGEVLAEGIKMRAVGTSTLNDVSSRSHAVLTMEIVSGGLVRARGTVAEAEAAVVPVGKALDDHVMLESAKLVRTFTDDNGKFCIELTCDERCRGNGAPTVTVDEWLAAHASFVERILELHAEKLALEQAVSTAKQVEAQIETSAPSCLMGSVTLVDLAGSDFDTRDLGPEHTLQQRRESNQINTDLLAVKECLEGLANRNGRLPFRRSTLTRVLQSALVPRGGRDGGRSSSSSSSVMLATVSPAVGEEKSTVGTLRYAAIAAGSTAAASTAKSRSGGAARSSRAQQKEAPPKPWQKKKGAAPGASKALEQEDGDESDSVAVGPAQETVIGSSGSDVDNKGNHGQEEQKQGEKEPAQSGDVEESCCWKL